MLPASVQNTAAAAAVENLLFPRCLPVPDHAVNNNNNENKQDCISLSALSRLLCDTVLQPRGAGE